MKRLLAALLLCLVLVTLTGCHGTEAKEAFTMPEEFDSSRDYEITFWAKNDTNKNQVEIYNRAIADFEELYPNIHVKIKLYTDYSRIYNDVITNIATDTTPNVCISYPDNIATYMTGTNEVVCLDSVLEDSRYGLGGECLRFTSPTKEEIVPQFLEECKIKGSYYALPFMRSTEACYVNKTMLNALGYELPEQLTWDFVWEVSEKALKKNADGTFAVNGQNVLIPFIYKSTDNMMIQMLYQQDAGYSTENGDILIFNDTTKEILYTISDHTKTGAFSTFKISSYPANFFDANQCLFAIDSTAGATWVGSDAPLTDISADKRVDFETAVCTIPQYDPENPKMISQGPSVCLFNKDDPQEVLASWLFLQFLLTDEVQLPYSETEGYIPVTTKAQKSAEYQDYLAREGEDEDHYAVKIQSAKLLLNHVGETFVTPVFNGSASLRNAAGQLIEETAKSTRRGETIDELYMETLFGEITSLYRLNRIGIDNVSGDTSQDLGPLPTESVVLLACLGIAWVLIIVWYFAKMKEKKDAGKSIIKEKK